MPFTGKMYIVDSYDGVAQNGEADGRSRRGCALLRSAVSDRVSAVCPGGMDAVDRVSPVDPVDVRVVFGVSLRHPYSLRSRRIFVRCRIGIRVAPGGSARVFRVLVLRLFFPAHGLLPLRRTVGSAGYGKGPGTFREADRCERIMLCTPIFRRNWWRG